MTVKLIKRYLWCLQNHSDVSVSYCLHQILARFWYLQTVMTVVFFTLLWGRTNGCYWCRKISRCCHFWYEVLISTQQISLQVYHVLSINTVQIFWDILQWTKIKAVSCTTKLCVVLMFHCVSFKKGRKCIYLGLGSKTLKPFWKMPFLLNEKVESPSCLCQPL